ncbi:hypothetical protein QG37_06419 [Candidozyma auris]|nr:hypothetical protein QG37_06419 [[Candida] auris]
MFLQELRERVGTSGQGIFNNCLVCCRAQKETPKRGFDKLSQAASQRCHSIHGISGDSIADSSRGGQ